MSLEFDRRNDPLAFVDVEVDMEGIEHEEARNDIVNTLRFRFAGRDDVFVACNLGIQYDERDPWKLVAADAFAWVGPPPGGGPRPRASRSWQTWIHGVPDVVIEVASASTVGNDLGKKRKVYEAMGVSEYYLFDPLAGDFERCSLPEPLLGYRRRDERFERIEPVDGFRSPGLDLVLRLREGALRFADPASGKLLATPGELHVEVEELRFESAKLRTDNEELREQVRALRAELGELRKVVEELRRGRGRD